MEPYYISKDDMCYTVNERIIPDKDHFRSKGNGTEYAKPQGYYPAFDQALKKVAEEKLHTKKEYNSGHIDGCIWIPLSDLNSNIDEIKSQNFDEIYTVCLSGGRSAKAVNILKKYDIKAVNIRGGMISWNSLK